MLRDLRHGRFVRAAVLALSVTLAGTGCTALDDAMVAIFGRSMRDSRSFDPYENPHLPAENAVPFAVGNYPAQLGNPDSPTSTALAADVPPMTPAMMAQGGGVANELVNPVQPTDESLARGELLYDRFCAVCHGPEGMSADAPIVEKLPVMQAFNLATGNANNFTDGHVYGMVRVGRGLMPAYGHRIPHVDRWHVVNYVRQLQRQAGGAAGAEAGGGS